MIPDVHRSFHMFPFHLLPRRRDNGVTRLFIPFAGTHRVSSNLRYDAFITHTHTSDRLHLVLKMQDNPVDCLGIISSKGED